MNAIKRNLMMMVFVAFAALIFGTPAFADWGKGYGHHGCRHHGYGHHEWGQHGPGWRHRGYGPFGSLSEDDIEKLEQERTAFFAATKELRQEIYQKRLELASELAKKNPDAAKAAAAQKEISDLAARLAQKRLDHILRIREINPDFGRGFGGGGPMGPGMMHHGMMGPGGYGSWGPHHCPYGGPGGGYGMGPVMMGPGGGYGMGPWMMGPGFERSARGPGYGRDSRMMGPGKGRGMGPGRSGQDDSRQYDKGQGLPEKKEE